MDLKGVTVERCLVSQAPSRWGLFRALGLIAFVVLTQLALLSGSAEAHRRSAPNPSANYKPGPLPSSCSSAPTGAKCINAAVYYLNQARARLHLGPYKLPASFPKLAADRQVLILSNLDRVAYHLTPITGLTPALDRVARGGKPGNPGVLDAGDPILIAPGVQTTSNWAGGFPNIVMAYEAWMYDDGPGSGNLDCTATDHTGCWGHRQDVLAHLTAPGPSAMGVAAGKDRSGRPSYAQLIAKGHSSYTSGYSYRWSQAVAAGAGKHTYVVRRPDTRRVKIAGLSIQGRTLIVYIDAPKGIRTKCSLSRRKGSHWSHASFHRCGKTARFPNVGPGEYRIRVRSSLGTTSEKFTIR
jgi:hypothetical protein